MATDPRELIKKAYKLNFDKDISDEEIDEILGVVLERTRAETSKLPGFTEEKLKRYLSGNVHLVFSPAIIFIEIMDVIRKIGIEKFHSIGKYKRAREMEIAARLCLGHKKMSNEEWMIKIQDSPDIVLTRTGKRSMNEHFMDGARLEIMTIPEAVADKWAKDCTVEFVEFVMEKKFNKRYGEECSLLIDLDFAKEALDLSKISKALSGESGNPYRQIWATASISEDDGRFIVAQLYPLFSRVDFDPVVERSLIY